ASTSTSLSRRVGMGCTSEDSELPDPFADDAFERRPVRVDLFTRAERHQAPIRGKPFDEARGIGNAYLRSRVVLYLRSLVENDLHAIFRAQVHGREVIGSAEARPVPFDPLVDFGAHAEDDSPDGFDLALERMVEFTQEGDDIWVRLQFAWIGPRHALSQCHRSSAALHFALGRFRSM